MKQYDRKHVATKDDMKAFVTPEDLRQSAARIKQDLANNRAQTIRWAVGGALLSLLHCATMAGVVIYWVERLA